MKKAHFVFEHNESVTIGQDKFLLHFDMCLLKLGNGDIPVAELRDSLNIPPENLYRVQDDSDIAIRHFVENIFPDIDAIIHAPEQQ